MLTDSEAELVRRLRIEADSLKECFTRFSFQAIAFSAIVFGLLDKTETPESYLVVASAFVITMLLAVARVGTYKYGNSNLVHGYELHLEQTQNLTDTSDGWKSFMRNVGWEEARRAWRIVQPTVFRHLYYYNALVPNLLRREHRKNSTEYRWFEPATLIGTANVDACYHPGGYLRLMVTMLHMLALLATLPIWIVALKDWRSDELEARLLVGVALGLALFVLFRVLQDYPRLRLLEGGLLSIHSCAVMWQAVVLAHYRALERARSGAGRGYENYSKNLALEADSLRRFIFRIDAWMGY